MSITLRTLLVLLLFTSFAQAQTETATTRKSGAEQMRELHDLVKSRLRIGLGLSQATDLEGASFNSNGQTLATVDFSSGSTAALDVKWAQSLYQGPGMTKFNWYSSVAIERERSIGSGTVKALSGPNKGKSTTVQFASTKPTYQSNIVSAGLEWTPTERLYIPIGLTYPLLTRSSVSEGSFNLDPKIGTQIGIGGRLNDNVELELLYRRVSYDLGMASKSDPGTSMTGTVLSSGANFTARYIF